MRTLIENIVNRELSMLVESGTNRNTRRQRSTRLTGQQRRNRSYRRAFSESNGKDLEVWKFVKYIDYTSSKCLNKTYDWTLTRTVWGAKRICEFARTFKAKSKLLDVAKVKCDEFAHKMNQTTANIYYTSDESKKKGYGFNEKDVTRRITYIQNALKKAIRYGKKNNNGWDKVAKALLNVEVYFITNP